MGCFSSHSRKAPARPSLQKRFAGGAGRRNIPRQGSGPSRKSNAQNLLPDIGLAANCRRRRVRAASTRMVGTQLIAAMRRSRPERTALRYGTPLPSSSATRNQAKVRERRSRCRLRLRVVWTVRLPQSSRSGGKRAPLLKENGPAQGPRSFQAHRPCRPLPTIPGSKWMPSTAHTGRVLRPLQRVPSGSARRHKDERNNDEAPRGPCRPCGCGTVRRASAASSPVCTPEGKEPLIAPGTWEGSVACSPRGSKRLRLRSRFLDPAGPTAAEMSP